MQKSRQEVAKAVFSGGNIGTAAKCILTLVKFSTQFARDNFCDFRFDSLCTSALLGPVVQSVVSLTSSLRVISLTVLADSIHSILIFFAEKMLLTFFQQNISAYLRITRCKF